MSIKRFGVSLEEKTLENLDSLVTKHQFPNRSQAIRFLINEHLVEEKWNGNEEVAGAITLLYNHHKRDLADRSIDIQHDYHHLILSVQHVHLNHDNCLETIAVKGKSKELIDLSDKLISMKGVKHGKLMMSMTE